MKKISLIIFLISTINISSQEIKTYTGKYEHGKAIYEYYEDENYERIYHGEFTYDKLPEYASNQKINIKGQFINNIKEGIWYYSSNKNEYNITIQGNYKSNLRNGIWTFRKSKPDNIQNTYFLEFKNDTIINKFNLKGIKGQFDEVGNYIGKWYIENSGKEMIIEFNNHALTKLIYREKSTGKIYSKYTPNINFSKPRKKTQNLRNIYSASTDYNQNTGIRKFSETLNNRVYYLLRQIGNNDFDFVFLDDINTQPLNYISKTKNNDEIKGNQGHTDGNPYSSSYYGGGSGNKFHYGLNGRKKLSHKSFIQDCDEEGKVVVKIFVNRNGRVIKSLIQQSDNPCLNTSAKKMAMSYKFNKDIKAPATQTGYIIVNYALGQ